MELIDSIGSRSEDQQFLQRPKAPSGVCHLFEDHQSGRMEVELTGFSAPFLAIRISKLMHMRALRDRPDVEPKL